MMVEFVSKMSTTGALMGNFDSTERILGGFLPKDRVTQIMEEIRGPAGRNMWEKLSNVQEQVLANYLKNEYPQTVAVVLAKVRPEHAAKVLACLPSDFAAECVQRMLGMEPVQREILEKIETTLRTEFMSNLARTSKRDSHELMAEIFNNFDRQTESRFVTALEEKNRESADRIRALMFVFEDLVEVDDRGFQALLREISSDSLIVALKGASEGIKEKIFKNMSKRAAEMLRDDLEVRGPVKVSEVETAQKEILGVARRLSESGELVLGGKGGEQYV